MSSPSSLRIYATAYRSITLPCDTDAVWDSIAPPASIASWGCTIVERVDIDDHDPALRTVFLVPSTPGTTVTVTERLVKAERTPAGEKGTLVYENVDAGAASPFPCRLVELKTEMNISKITTLTSPLGRSFVELRATFVVCSPQDAETTRAFLESSLFDPLLHSMAEMLVPVHPFRDAMFGSVMRHFEQSLEELAAAAARIRTMDARRGVLTNSSSDGGGNNNNNNSNSSPNSAATATATTENPVSVSRFSAGALSISQELYSAFLETSRELRRLEKKLEGDAEERERKKYGADALPSAEVGSGSSYVPAATAPAVLGGSGSSNGSRRPMMQEHIGLNVGNVFGHKQQLSAPGTYIVSTPVAARMVGSSSSSSSQEQQQQQHRRQPPVPPGWEQEMFDDDADDLVAEDAGRLDEGSAELRQKAPPPPPRRVLGGR